MCCERYNIIYSIMIVFTISTKRSSQDNKYFFFIVSIVTHEIDGQCYQCALYKDKDGEDGPEGCGNPFNSTNIPTEECAGPCKVSFQKVDTRYFLSQIMFVKDRQFKCKASLKKFCHNTDPIFRIS